MLHGGSDRGECGVVVWGRGGVESGNRELVYIKAMAKKCVGVVEVGVRWCTGSAA